MSVQHQLPHIPILRRWHSDAGEVLFQHQLQKMLGIPAIVLLLAYPLGSNLGGIAHSQFTAELT